MLDSQSDPPMPSTVMMGALILKTYSRRRAGIGRSHDGLSSTHSFSKPSSRYLYLTMRFIQHPGCQSIFPSRPGHETNARSYCHQPVPGGRLKIVNGHPAMTSGGGARWISSTLSGSRCSGHSIRGKNSTIGQVLHIDTPRANTIAGSSFEPAGYLFDASPSSSDETHSSLLRPFRRPACSGSQESLIRELLNDRFSGSQRLMTLAAPIQILPGGVFKDIERQVVAQRTRVGAVMHKMIQDTGCRIKDIETIQFGGYPDFPSTVSHDVKHPGDCR